jgi:hypothetical protein
MAIIYSYPHATPSIGDTVIGTVFKENVGITTNSFYISDLINLMDTTTVTYTGVEPLTLSELNSLYPNAMVGFKVQAINPEVLTMYEKTISSIWISYPINYA